MKLSMGIVGLPNVGKSTLFKILTNKDIVIANYPFATIDPNVGIVTVPDERLNKLSKMSNTKKIVPAIVEFYDIAGLVKGASSGEGLGNQFLSHIRETDAIVHVLRCFQSDDIIHVENKVDPLSDMGVVNAELIFKDLDTIEKRIAKLEGEARGGNKEKLEDLELVKKVKERLLSDELATTLGLEVLNNPTIKDMNLLTAKPQIFLLNGTESDVSEELRAKIAKMGSSYVAINLHETDNIDELIKKSYEVLGLASFITTGEEETRAWTIKQGAKAPQAAGEIHTDFEKKFIRAEVIAWDKLLEAGSFSAAKQKGWVRLEGKEYVVSDGDVLIIKHG